MGFFEEVGDFSKKKILRRRRERERDLRKREAFFEKKRVGFFEERGRSSKKMEFLEKARFFAKANSLKIRGSLMKEAFFEKPRVLRRRKSSSKREGFFEEEFLEEGGFFVLRVRTSKKPPTFDLWA